MTDDDEGLLIREHAHRVANDMAVAAAALRLADRRVGGDPALSGAVARIEAVARVQRLLCLAPTDARVPLDGALRGLCAAMASASPGSVSVKVDAAPITVAGGDAWIVSLCVHELVANALRHAGDRGADVRVVVRGGADAIAVAVIDRGPARSWSRPGGQGGGLVDRLAARLGGTVRRSWSPLGGGVELSLPGLVPAASMALGAA